MSFKLYNPIEDVIAKVNSGGGGGGGVPSTGGTFTGNVIMAPPSKISQSAPPTAASDLVNLGYLQATYLPLAGGSLTGNLTMSEATQVIQCTAPSTPCSLTNKQYVDGLIANATIANATTTTLGKIQLGGDLNGSGTTASNPVIANQAITNTKLANLIGNSKLKGSSSVSSNATDITLGSSLIMNGAILDVNPSTVPTIPVPVSQGGTGVVTLPAKYVVSNGTAPFSSVAAIPLNDVTGAVKTVNSVGPDGLGNVTIPFGTVTSGVLSARPTQPQPNGDIYIVSGDPIPANNGLTYISDGSAWNQVISPAGFAPFDSRYLKKTNDSFDPGNTLTFPATAKLILTDDAVNPTDAMNLNTFNNLKAGQSRFGVVEFATSGDLIDLGGPAANSGIAVVKPQSIGVTKLNLSGTSRIFGSNNTSSAVTELTMGPGIEITGAGVLQANLSSGVITNVLTSGSNNITSNVAGSVANLNIGTTSMSQIVGLDASGALVRGPVSNIPLSNNLSSSGNVISSNVAGTVSNLTIGSGTITEVVGLDGTGTLVRAGSAPVTNNLTSSGNVISSNVSGTVSNLTIGSGTIAEVVGLNVSGALVRASSAPTTNSLIGGNNCIVSNVNGIVSNLTPVAGTISQAIGFNSSGALVTGAVVTVTTNNLSASSNSISSNVNGIISTLTPSSGTINQFLGFNTVGNLVTSNLIINSQLTPGANSTLKGTNTTGGIDDITLGSGLSMTGSVLNTTQSVASGIAVDLGTQISAGPSARFGVDAAGKLNMGFFASGTHIVYTHGSESTGNLPTVAGGTCGGNDSIGATLVPLCAGSQRSKGVIGNGGMYQVYDSTTGIMYFVNLVITVLSTRQAFIKVTW